MQRAGHAGAALAEAFYQASPYAERLFDPADDFDERYRYTCDAAREEMTVVRRRSPWDNRGGAGRPVVLGPWEPEFTGSLTDFIAAYTHPGIASHAQLERYDLPTAMPRFCF